MSSLGRVAMVGWTDIDNYCMWLAAGGRSPGTIVQRRFYLGRLAASYPVADLVTLDDLTQFIGTSTWGPEARKSARAAARGFFRWAVLTEKTAHSPAENLPTVRVPAGRPRPAPTDVLTAAIANATSRERLMLHLAAFAGLRVSEISRVHTSNIVDCSLRVTGKGGRVRTVPLHPTLAGELERCPSGWVFAGQVNGHLSPHHISRLLSALLGPGWSAHCLRHRFASLCYAYERDILAVQTLLGHASVTTTQIYTAVPDGAMRAAVYAVAPVAA